MPQLQQPPTHQWLAPNMADRGQGTTYFEDEDALQDDSMHAARRGGSTVRLASPYDRFHRASSMGTSHASALSSIGSSSWRTGSGNTVASSSNITMERDQPSSSSVSGGVERSVKRRNRGSNGPKRQTSQRSEPLSDNDQVNLDHAINNFIAAMCQKDCWPESQSADKGTMVEEACSQANGIAARENRQQSTIDNFFLRDVSINQLYIYIFLLIALAGSPRWFEMEDRPQVSHL